MRLNDVPVFLSRFGRLFLAAVCLTGSFQNSAIAQFSGSTQSKVTTVEQARMMRVGTRVTLTGSLKKEVRRAQYLFRDATGDIRVRIEHEFWRGRDVTTRSVLRLRGKVESDVRGRFVDVYYFQILE
jgi:uncharacterized protein (TIGR00156 family)